MTTDRATEADAAATVVRHDTESQKAVAENDAATMDRILADDFVLVTGAGKVFPKVALLEEARSGRAVYERQDDTERTMRVQRDTAVVTALLWAKGTEDGEPFEYRVWFSDAYVRLPRGGRYLHGQSSLRLPYPAQDPRGDA